MSAFLLLSFAFAQIKNQLPAGEKLFQSKCAKCHGADGTKERAGAKNLRLSKLPDADITAMIENGKKAMPSFKNKFSQEEIKQLAEFVKTFRK